MILLNKILLPDIENVTQSYLGFIDYREYLKLITDENGDIRRSVFMIMFVITRETIRLIMKWQKL